jgi:hypothetical protein
MGIMRLSVWLYRTSFSTTMLGVMCYSGHHFAVWMQIIIAFACCWCLFCNMCRGCKGLYLRFQLPIPLLHQFMFELLVLYALLIHVLIESCSVAELARDWLDWDFGLAFGCSVLWRSRNVQRKLEQHNLNRAVDWGLEVVGMCHGPPGGSFLMWRSLLGIALYYLPSNLAF